LEELNAAVELYRNLGLAEFIIFTAVICAATWFIRVFVKKNETNIVGSSKTEFARINQVIEEVKTITENYNSRFIKLEERIIDVDANFRQLGEGLNDLSTAVTSQGEFQGVLSRAVLEHQLFDDSYPSMLNRLKAFYRLAAMGFNGRVKQKGMLLILNNQSLWLDVASLEEIKALKIADQKYFDETMSDIKKRVFDQAA
jgi:hypothetical protein